MKLFKYEGFNLTISEEAMLLKPFKALWKRDRSKNKEIALMELGYIYFMEDPRSDYVSQSTDREIRDAKIREGEGIPQNWQPDDKVKEAMQFYAGFKPAAALLLEDLKKSIDIVRNGLVTQADLADIDPEKKPKILDSYSNTISKLMKLAKELDETEKALATAMVQNDKVRGSMEKSMLEDI